MVVLCWIVEKIGKFNICLCSNDDYGIFRVCNNFIGKLKMLDMDKYVKIKSDLIKFFLCL